MTHGRNIYFHSHLQMDLTQNTESEFFLVFFNMQSLTLDLYFAQWFTNIADLVLNKCF